MAGSRCWSALRRLDPRLNATGNRQQRSYSDHRSDHQSDHDFLVRAIAALGCSGLAFAATLLGRLRAAELALGAALLGSFRAAAALLGDFCAAARVPEAATFDSAACLAPPVFAAVLGVAPRCAAAASLFGIALAAARAFAAVLPAGAATFERDAAMLSVGLGVSAAALCIPARPTAARTAS